MKKARNAGMILFVLILVIFSFVPIHAENEESLLTRIVSDKICRTEKTVRLCYGTKTEKEIRGSKIHIELNNLSQDAIEGMNRCDGRVFFLDLMEEDSDSAVVVRSFLNYYVSGDDGQYRLGEWREYYVNPDIIENDGDLELFLRYFVAAHPLDTTDNVKPPLEYTISVNQ